MKVLFFTHLPPPIHGVTYINSLIYRSKLINESFETEYHNLSLSKTNQDLNNKGLMKVLFAIKHFLKSIYKVLFTKYDVLYISLAPNGVTFFRDGFLVLLASIKGKKCLAHLHGKGVDRLRRKKIWHIGYTLVLKRLYIIHLSKKLYSDISFYVSEDKCFFLANTIDPINESIQSISKVPNQLSFIANLRPSKGLFELLKIMDYIVNNDGLNEVKLNIIGSFRTKDVEVETKNKIKELNLQENIVFKGALFDEDKMIELASSSIFIYPTLEEAFPLVVIESLQLGTPIVAYDEGAISDMVVSDENGYLIEKGNTIEFAQKVIKILNDNALAEQFGKNSYQKYCDSYTCSHFENALFKILSKFRIN